MTRRGPRPLKRAKVREQMSLALYLYAVGFTSHQLSNLFGVSRGQILFWLRTMSKFEMALDR